MKNSLTKVLSFATKKLHPIRLRMCRTMEDYIGLLDSNIRFSKVHQVCDKQFRSYPIGQIINKHSNILIPEEGRTMWHLKEASQATSFYPLAQQGVVVGTCNEMRQQYPEQDFLSHQKIIL